MGASAQVELVLDADTGRAGLKFKRVGAGVLITPSYYYLSWKVRYTLYAVRLFWKSV